MKSVRLDGIEYGLNTPTEIDAYIAAVARSEKARSDSAASAKTELDRVTARADAAESKVRTLEAEVADLKDPKRLDSAVSARVAIVSKAQRILGTEERFDGLTNRQVQEKAILKADPNLKVEGRSDDYVTAIFDVIGTPAKRADAASQIAAATTVREDATPAPKTGRAAMLEHNAKAASGPLALSKV